MTIKSEKNAFNVFTSIDSQWKKKQGNRIHEQKMKVLPKRNKGRKKKKEKKWTNKQLNDNKNRKITVSIFNFNRKQGSLNNGKLFICIKEIHKKKNLSVMYFIYSYSYILLFGNICCFFPSSKEIWTKRFYVLWQKCTYHLPHPKNHSIKI